MGYLLSEKQALIALLMVIGCHARGRHSIIFCYESLFKTIEVGKSWVGWVNFLPVHIYCKSVL